MRWRGYVKLGKINFRDGTNPASLIGSLKRGPFAVPESRRKPEQPDPREARPLPIGGNLLANEPEDFWLCRQTGSNPSRVRIPCYGGKYREISSVLTAESRFAREMSLEINTNGKVP